MSKLTPRQVPRHAVAVTGMGMISPLGNQVEGCWDALLKGQSGITPIDRFDASNLPTRIAGQAVAPTEEDSLAARVKRRYDQHVHWGVAAARQAWRDSGLDQYQGQELDRTQIGTCIGSGIGGISYSTNAGYCLKEGGLRKVSPFHLPGSLINMVNGVASIELDLQGPSLSIATACATGIHSIGTAARIIERGDATVMLAGGAEATITDVSLAVFLRAQALSTHFNDEPDKASRPWDINRDGFVMGEGAGILVLERLDHAQARNAPIHAIISGFGMSGDAYHITSPEPNGRNARNCMELAIEDADLQPTDIDYINAHATSTKLGDLAEAQAISSLFGSQNVPVNSTKSMIGHLLGAAGAVESIATILSIRDQTIHPTINLDQPEQDLGIDIVTDTRKAPIKHALCNSFGFGGTNAALILSAPE
ncbi:MAG: beta-ketoacyl-ACP synthase II [Gammaproteobacteria bacterium]